MIFAALVATLTVLASKRHADSKDTPKLAFTFDLKEEPKGSLTRLGRFWWSFMERKDPAIAEIEMALGIHSQVHSEEFFDLDKALDSNDEERDHQNEAETRESSSFEYLRSYFAYCDSPIVVENANSSAERNDKEKEETTTKQSAFINYPSISITPSSKPQRTRTLEDILEEPIGEDSLSDYDAEKYAKEYNEKYNEEYDELIPNPTHDDYTFPRINLMYDDVGEYIGNRPRTSDDKNPDLAESYSSEDDESHERSKNSKASGFRKIRKRKAVKVKKSH